MNNNKDNSSPFGDFDINNILTDYPQFGNMPINHIKPVKDKNKVVVKEEVINNSPEELDEGVRYFSPEEESIADDILYYLQEFGKLQARASKITEALHMTLGKESALDELENTLEETGLISTFGPQRPKIAMHPLFKEQMTIARLCDPDKSEKDLKKEVADNLNRETIMLGRKSKFYMEKVHELLDLDSY